MTAGAVRETASILRERILAIAANKLEAALDDLELADSRVSVRGTPSIGMTLAELAAVAYFEPYSLPAGVPAGLTHPPVHAPDVDARNAALHDSRLGIMGPAPGTIVLVFVFLQGLGTNEQFTYAFSTVPQEIRTGQDIARPVRVELGDQAVTIPLQPTPGPVYLTLLVSMFMHGGIGHLLGNMLFLWIFGDNVEDRLGHLSYLLFYLLAGIAAMALQTAFALDSLVPTVGASGAIAGVMGAYLIMYPGALIQVIVLPLFFIPFFVPASLLILFWFLMQVLGGLADLGATTGSSIAWWAHIGGFSAGVLLILLAGGRGKPRASPTYS